MLERQVNLTRVIQLLVGTIVMLSIVLYLESWASIPTIGETIPQASLQNGNLSTTAPLVQQASIPNRSYFNIVTQQSLLLPTRGKKSSPTVAKTSPPSQPALQPILIAVILSTGKKSALIKAKNGDAAFWVKEREINNGIQVLEIHPDHIDVAVSGKTRKVFLSDSSPSLLSK